MDYIVHGLLRTRTLEWVSFPFSRGSSQPRDRTQVSPIAGRFFTRWATREVYQEFIFFQCLETFILLFFWTEVQNQFHWDKMKMSAGPHSSWRLQGIICSQLSQLLMAASIPWLTAGPITVSMVTLSFPFLFWISFCLSFMWTLFFLLHLVLTQIQGYAPISRALTISTKST